ncbi:unnamed protein product [Mytilus edulis]|uniref:Uncharacterized protein n=1 Tax=Mytilus edulis TaxID=6550 RepID=A0A8S3URL3_MYTED|nr:unnamed protein product [Mytilus edulis]
MSEHTEESLLLQDDSLPDKSSDGATRSSSDRDLHDTSSLFKLYMDGKMDSLESKLIADSKPSGWSTVREYESNDIASDNEDEKTIRQAESRAMKDKTKGVPLRIPTNPDCHHPKPMLILPTINSFRDSPFVTVSHGVSRASGTCASFVSSLGIGEKIAPLNLVGVGYSGVANDK